MTALLTNRFNPSWKAPPRFISFEGIDGCGKSTLLQEFSRWLHAASIPHITTREPGGTRLGERIRELLLDPSHGPVNQRAETLLYTASRAQLVAEVIQPALERGAWVLADRFSDATLAYQGYGRGLDSALLEQLQNWATGGLRPHVTVLLDCNVESARQRMISRNAGSDRMEQEDRGFHERVRAGYLEMARSAPERFIVLDAGKSIAEVTAAFHEALRGFLAGRKG